MDLNRRPVYLQLRDVFVGFVTSGEWKPNMLLPNEVQLAGRFSVSVGTIRKVMDELSDLGLINRVQGRGTFVSEALRQDGHSAFDPLRNLDGSRIKWDSPHISIEEGQASAQEALRFGLATREFGVVRLSWLRFKNGWPIAFQCSTVPTNIVLDIPRLRHVSGLAELYSRAGVLAQSSEDTLVQATPSDEVSEKLKLPTGAQAQLLSRRFLDDKANIIGICMSWLVLRNEIYVSNYRLRPNF